MTEENYTIPLTDREVWDEFELSLIDTYKKYPTTENAENILKHYLDYHGQEVRPSAALESWIKDALQSYFDNSDSKVRDPIEKALGLTEAKGQKKTHEYEHAIIHRDVWKYLFQGLAQANAFMSVAVDLDISHQKVRAAFNHCSYTVKDKETGEELTFMDIEKYDRGINAYIMQVRRPLKAKESKIICEVLNKKRKTFEKDNPYARNDIHDFHFSDAALQKKIRPGKEKHLRKVTHNKKNEL